MSEPSAVSKPNQHETIRLLLLGGSTDIAQQLHALLTVPSRYGFDLEHARGRGAAVRSIERRPPDLALLYVGDNAALAQAAVRQLRAKYPTIPVVVLAESDTMVTDAIDSGAGGFLVRGVLSHGQLLWTITQAIRSQRAFIELNIARERARQAAAYDQLTGLANRSLFADRLEQATAAARRGDQLIAVLFLDLDRFKSVNDTLGHVAGDALLRSTAARISSCLRKSDTGARLGGDEFAVLLTQISGLGGAVRVAEKLLGLIRKPVSLRGRSQVISTSIGIATFPGEAKDAETLLKCADIAMYNAKNAGRDRYAVYHPSFEVVRMDRDPLEERLRDALDGGELTLHYQPVVDVKRGRLVGAEALIRWHHPELGLVLPAEFLRIAEDSDLIIPLGEWVIRTACRQAAIWQRDGRRALRMAVNVSPQQFQPDDFVSRVQSILKETGIPPDTLELELTERSLLHDTRRTLTQLAALKHLGVRIAIDDFGTGYSALAYLKQLPVDALKLDQSFVRALATDPADATITQTIVQLARELNLSTVGEGVERLEQMQLLAAYGCYRMQGFLFGEATEPERFTSLLSEPPFWWMRRPAARSS